MALTTARISNSRWRPPGLGGGIKFLIRSHSASVRSVGYGLAAIPPVYRTGAIYGRLFKQSLSKLDPNNRRWKEQQLARARAYLELAERMQDAVNPENARRDVEARIADIDRSFDTQFHEL